MSDISRRDLFRSIFRRRPESSETQVTCPPVPAPAPGRDTPQVALILDRFCLAWQGAFCSVCSERCPVEGAITTEKGKPRITQDVCTGCRICHDVCPAPKNAVFLVPRNPRPGMVAAKQLPPDP